MPGKLTIEEWNALPTEEQELRQDEKPEEPGKEAPPQPSIEDLTKKVEELTGKLATSEEEKKGIYGDMKGERETRQRLETAIAALQEQLVEKGKEGDPLAGKDDDEFVSVGDVKKLLATAEKTAGDSRRREDQGEELRKSRENYATDEERMSAKTDLKVPYKDAIEEFNRMAKKNRGLWRSVHEESIRSGGKPAELAYRIALTSDTFVGKIEAKAREALILKLEKEGTLKPRKLPAGGPGAGPLDPSLMSEEDLLKLPEKELEEMLRKTG